MAEWPASMTTASSSNASDSSRHIRSGRGTASQALIGSISAHDDDFSSAALQPTAT
jgi:hypothetical protein